MQGKVNLKGDREKQGKILKKSAIHRCDYVAKNGNICVTWKNTNSTHDFEFSDESQRTFNMATFPTRKAHSCGGWELIGLAAVKEQEL